MAKELTARPPVATFPTQSQARHSPYADAYSVLAQDKAPLAILSRGKGGMTQTIERLEDATLMAREQGREVMILASDNRSAQLLAQSDTLAGHVAPRHTLNADSVFTPHSTLIVEQAETLTLKDAVLLLEKARASDVQLLLLDSERRNGWAMPSRSSNRPVPLSIASTMPQNPGIRGQRVRQGPALCRTGPRLRDTPAARRAGGRASFRARDQAQLTGDIRSALRDAGQLHGPDVTLNVLSPVWLDSKTRHQRDTYRAGMVMEQWDDKSKTMHRYRIEQVADKTHSLVLVGEQRGAPGAKVRAIDSSWSLFESQRIEVAAGDTLLKVLGREAQGELKAQQTLTVTSVEAGQLRVETPAGELTLPPTGH